MTVLTDITTFLAAQSTKYTLLSGTAGNLSWSDMPDAASVADTFVSVYETGGLGSDMSFSTGSTGAYVEWEYPRVQLMSRSTLYATARSNAETAYLLLDGYAGRLPTSTGTLYGSIEADTPPFSIGQDDNGRWLVQCSFQVMKRVG